jgi:hypothetical protein
VANYLCTANFLLNDSFPASVGMKFISSDSEATVESTWHGSVKSAWNSAPFLALMPADTHFISTSTSTASASWKQTTKTTTDEDIPGGGGASLPYHDALIVTWRTNLASKAGHGRWYWPPLTTAAIATGGYVFSATAMTDAQTAFEIMTAAWSGALTPVLLHRKTLTTDNIIKADMPDQVAVQNRRADKRVPGRTTITV